MPMETVVKVGDQRGGFPEYSTLALNPRAFGVSPGDAPTFVRLLRQDTNRAEFQTNKFTMALRTGGSSTIDACINDLHDWLMDVITSKLAVGDRADLILVKPSSSGRTWLCGVRRLGEDWHADAIEAERPAKMETQYALADTGEQNKYVMRSYLSFLETFGCWTVDAGGAQPDRTLLRAKVDRRELWFLRFPLGMFVKLKLDGFVDYSGCQWIVTNRSISSTAATQISTEREMADTRAFLTGTQIVINTYSAQANLAGAESIRTGLALVIELLEHFRSIPIGKGPATLKWTINPSPHLLRAILLSSETRFLFADFEAADNIWHTGDGEHRCWQSCEHAAQYTGDRRFDLSPFRERLAHIQLLRVFHCNSIYDPFRPRVEPADEQTIAGQLLASEAFFVEGSVGAESVPDFICMLLKLLLERADLRTILWAKCLAGQCDVARLVDRANALFAERGYSIID